MWRRRKRALDGLEEDIRDHLEREVDEQMARGLPADEAQRRALVKFGNVTLVRQDTRAVWSSVWLEQTLQDLRYAVRGLRRAPGFTIVTVASLSFGLSLIAAMVSVVNAYLVRSLPYPVADRLFHVMYAPTGPWEPRGMTALDWTSISDAIEFPITALSDTLYLADGEFAESVRGLRVGRGFVEGLGVRAVLGRSLVEADFSASDRVALIGHALWRNRYGADPDIVGRVVRADVEAGRPTTEVFRIVGVLSPDFYFGRDSRERVDLLVPLTAPARTYMVRLRAGVPPAFAEQRITAAAGQVASDLPSDWAGVHLESAHERYVGQLRPVLVGVTIASGLVLVIVCANIAVLMLLRSMKRQKELAVRAALGSGRAQLARMLLIEASVVCGAAVAIAIALTSVSLRLLAPLIETQLERPAPGGAAAIAMDGTVLLLVVGISLVVAVSLSCFPLLTPWQRRLGQALRRDATGIAYGRSMSRARSGLIAFEVAGTLILLVSCGLMLRSVVAMVRADLGFEPERLVWTRVVLRGTDYADGPAFSRFYRQFAERLSATIREPVVFTTWPPFAEHPKQLVETDDRVGHGLSAGAIGVDAGYFTTLGIDLRAGRDVTSADVTADQPVAVISETLARRLWSDSNSVIGRYVRTVQNTPGGPRTNMWRVVVGVAADVRQAYSDAELSDIYVPLSPASLSRYGFFYTRTDGQLPALLAAMRRIASSVDPHAVINEPRLVVNQDRQLAGTRFLTGVLVVFAAIAAFLAILGIYGVTAYAVQQREREVAIRMAVGARGSAVIRLFVGEGGLVLFAGLVAGLFGAVAAARVLERQLFAVQAFDLPTLAAACGILAMAGVLATWWPAYRAALRNPVVSLKES